MYDRETCSICGYVVSEGQKAPKPCVGCGMTDTFVTKTFTEKGDKGEGGPFHGVAPYATKASEGSGK